MVRLLVFTGYEPTADKVKYEYYNPDYIIRASQSSINERVTNLEVQAGNEIRWVTVVGKLDYVISKINGRKYE